MAEIVLGTGNQPGPSLLNQTSGMVPGVITTTTEQLFGMARKSSLWTMTFGLACCLMKITAQGKRNTASTSKIRNRIAKI